MIVVYSIQVFNNVARLLVTFQYVFFQQPFFDASLNCAPLSYRVGRAVAYGRHNYRNRLAVPSVKLSIGSRSFSVSGPTVWNALPDYLRNPTLSIDVFKVQTLLINFFYLLSINTTLQRTRNIVPLR